MTNTGAERVKRALLRVIAWSLAAYLVLPLLVIFPASFTDRPYLSLPDKALSLQHYADTLDDPIWLSSIFQSLGIATASMALATVLGCLTAVACWRISNPATNLIRLILLGPIAVPAIVTALATYRFFIALHLFDTHLGVVIAHTIHGIPYVMMTVSASLAGFDRRQEQAGRNLGASHFRVLWHVIVPQIMPGLLSGAALAFTYSFDEIVTVLFITGRRVSTLPKRIWDQVSGDLDPTVSAVAVLLILATLVIFAAIRIARTRFAAHSSNLQA